MKAEIGQCGHLWWADEYNQLWLTSDPQKCNLHTLQGAEWIPRVICTLARWSLRTQPSTISCSVLFYGTMWERIPPHPVSSPSAKCVYDPVSTEFLPLRYLFKDRDWGALVLRPEVFQILHTNHPPTFNSAQIVKPPNETAWEHVSSLNTKSIVHVYLIGLAWR